MITAYENFTGIFDNVFPDDYCQHLITEFNNLEKNSFGHNRQTTDRSSKHEKDDFQILINLRNHPLLPFNNKPTIDVFFDGLQQCYDTYTEKYSVLKNQRIRGSAVKMQRTSPGGGYHIWHGEQGNGESENRVLVYMLYLNTLQPENAGETEFLYHQKRYNPVENRMLIWPAAFTHAHRGNMVIGEEFKYIVTGWFYYE
jgi:hypothetical protein